MRSFAHWRAGNLYVIYVDLLPIIQPDTLRRRWKGRLILLRKPFWPNHPVNFFFSSKIHSASFAWHQSKKTKNNRPVLNFERMFLAALHLFKWTAYKWAYQRYINYRLFCFSRRWRIIHLGGESREKKLSRDWFFHWMAYYSRVTLQGPPPSNLACWWIFR